MQYQLDLVLKPAEAAVLRVIGMVERRGFVVQAIHGDRGENYSGPWQLQLIVTSSRPPETLQRQLEKLYDCQSVHIQPLAASLNHAGAAGV